MSTKTPVNSDFKYVLDVVAIPATGHAFALHASAKQLNALAERFTLAEMQFFEMTGAIRPIGKGHYELKGDLKAGITQNSVISLEPVAEKVELAVFVPLLLEPHHSDQIQHTPETLETLDRFEPIYFSGNEIDIAECAVQVFAEQLNLYPRKPGEDYADLQQPSGDGDREEKYNPFEILQKLKNSPS